VLLHETRKTHLGMILRSLKTEYNSRHTSCSKIMLLRILGDAPR
jgi:hypothetical protein